MKKVLLIGLGVALGAAALLYPFREPIKQALYALTTADMFVAQDNDDFDPGPATGSRFPGLRATYQGRDITLLDEFAGPNGTVLVALRSLDWCPYCMRQLVQLQASADTFAEAGIGLVAISYDEPRLQQDFIDRFAITLPVLSDSDALSFKTLGILNKDYQRGDTRYGIPYPGMIVIDRDGVVVGKLFIEAYSSRVDSRAALVFARQALALD